MVSLLRELSTSVLSFLGDWTASSGRISAVAVEEEIGRSTTNNNGMRRCNKTVREVISANGHTEMQGESNVCKYQCYLDHGFSQAGYGFVQVEFWSAMIFTNSEAMQILPAEEFILSAELARF